MRDGNSPEVVTVLDTTPELEIIKNQIEVVPERGYSMSWCRLDYEESLPGRFLQQTRIGGDATPFYINDSGEGWQDNPEFEVLAWDLESVLLYAEKALENKKFTDRFNRSARERNVAAEGIIRALNNYKADNPEPPSGPSSGAMMFRD